MEKQIDVSVVFVNYKTPKLTLEAIESVIEKSSGFSYEIIVVDNSCDSHELIELNNLIGNKAKIIDAKSNLGFGKANNMATLYTKGKYLFFLNTDTLLINNAIFELYKFLEDNKEVGIVGSNLYSKDLKPNHSFAKDVKDFRHEKKNNSIVNIIKRKLGLKRNDFNYDDKPLLIRGYVCGASLMIRTSIFYEIGGFESEIFMYAEEALLCFMAIHKCDMKIYNVPSSKIIHFEGKSLNIYSSQKARMLIDGNYVYYKKAFNDEIAYKYLNLMISIFKRKKFLASITFNKDRKKSYNHIIEACNNKKMEISN